MFLSNMINLFEFYLSFYWCWDHVQTVRILYILIRNSQMVDPWDILDQLVMPRWCDLT